MNSTFQCNYMLVNVVKDHAISMIEPVIHTSINYFAFCGSVACEIIASTESV